MCRRFAPGLVYVNEMVMATPVVHANAKTDRMISFAPDEHPRSLQLYGSDPEIMGKAVAKLCDAGRVDHIDINFGCPAAKVTRRGGGERRCRLGPSCSARSCGRPCRTLRRTACR